MRQTLTARTAFRLALLAGALSSGFAGGGMARPFVAGPGICEYENVADMAVPQLGDELLVAIDSEASRAFVLGFGGCNDFELIDNGDPVEFNQPSGVAIDVNGRIYISDTGEDRILVFNDIAGLNVTDPLDLLTLFSQPSTGLNLNAPGGLGASDDGLLYIADTGAGRVQVANSIGQLVNTIGAPDDGNDEIAGEFLEPVDVAVCPTTAPGDFAGRVFVADRARDVIQVFNSDGDYIFHFGRSGGDRGELSAPVGIDVDLNCNVYVADRGNARAQMFDGNGAFLEDLGTVSTPSAIAVDPRPGPGAVFVASSGEDAISAFQFISYDTNFNGNSDDDGDGLPDIWEEEGIDIGFDGTVDYVLPGADRDRKNLYLEIDFTEGQALPDADDDPEADDAADMIVAAFANAPVSNPDGSTGIDLHIERGEEGPFDGLLVFFDVSDGAADMFPGNFQFFDNIKGELFGSPSERADAPEVLEAKSLAFRYALMVETVCDTGSIVAGVPTCSAPDPVAGKAEIGGDDFVFALRNADTGSGGGIGEGGVGGPGGGSPFPTDPSEEAQRVAGVLMHEYGHNLGIRHGGADEFNCKPNYMSVMNYSFSTGIRTLDPDQPYGVRFDYSSEVLDTLDESDLDETVGIGLAPVGPDGDFTDLTRWGNTPDFGIGRGDGPLDWNLDNDGGEDTSAVAEINNPGDDLCEGEGDILVGWNDWENLSYSFRQTGNFGNARVEVTENEPTHAQLDALDAEYDAFLNLRYAWAAKFLCVPLVGLEDTALSPGRYQTVINIHNPGPDDARLRKGIAIARSELDPRGDVTALEDDSLGPREAMSIDCTSIATRFDDPQPVGDGFVQLQSDTVLDVVAVYTSRDSVDVELIPVTDTAEDDMPPE
ncbi:MAG: hypothetical protein AAF913_11180, partial [Pseudomonadota bacterium]